jgi:hypothetical protein
MINNEVDSRKMQLLGIKFYQSENVDNKYLKLL